MNSIVIVLFVTARKLSWLPSGAWPLIVMGVVVR